MNNSLYAAAMGSRLEMLRLDVISNNLANYGTAGFKGDKPYFKDVLQFMSDKQFARSRKSVSRHGYIASVTNFRQGVIKNTGNPMDVCIQGDGFFEVNRGGKVGYTRSGAFRLDTEGRLRTVDGGIVRGEGGEITIGAGEVHIDGEGNISVDGQQVDKLKVVNFAEPRRLRKTSGNLFGKDQSALPMEGGDYKIVHKALEASNVNPVRQMTQMIEAGRNYEAYQKMIKIINDINERASNNLGRVQ